MGGLAPDQSGIISQAQSISNRAGLDLVLAPPRDLEPLPQISNFFQHFFCFLFRQTCCINSTAVFNAMISQLFLTLLAFLQKDCENV